MQNKDFIYKFESIRLIMSNEFHVGSFRYSHLPREEKTLYSGVLFQFITYFTPKDAQWPKKGETAGEVKLVNCH